MRVLVLGGIRSGKSQWAEASITELAGDTHPVRYLATGAPAGDDPDWAARVHTHRKRRPPHWSTIETTDVTTQLRSDATTAALIDDVGGWLTAVMDGRDAWSGGSVRSDVDALVGTVRSFPAPLAVVSPEVGLTVVPQTTAGRIFTDELGALNQRLAAVCDRVVLVVAGQPITVKDTAR